MIVIQGLILLLCNCVLSDIDDNKTKFKDDIRNLTDLVQNVSKKIDIHSNSFRSHPSKCIHTV